MTELQTPTPSQAKFMQAHRERRARIAALAKPDPGIICLSASARSQRADVPPAVKPEPSPEQSPVREWVERQVQIHKEPWFSIVEEIESPAKTPPPIQLIQKITAIYYGMQVSDLIAARRMGPLIRPRQVAIYLSKVLTLRSMPEIGRRFGGRDHSTILYSIRKIGKLLKSDDELAKQVEAIKAAIGASCD